MAYTAKLLAAKKLTTFDLKFILEKNRNNDTEAHNINGEL